MATFAINIACLLLVTLATTPSLGQLPGTGQSPPTPNPVIVRLPPPPVLEGPLAVNNVLTNARKVGENLLTGPASIIPSPNGWLYTTLETGDIAVLSPQGNLHPILRMSISTCGQPGAPEDACGRPMGLRADAESWLVVADAYNGIYRVNPQNGREQHYPYANARRVLVNNKPLGFVYDLAAARNGAVYFTSASSRWKRSQAVDAILEGDLSGRVLVFNPRLSGSSRLQELITNINFPTGIELSHDDSYLLVAEGARSRIFKAYLGNASPKGSTLELFAQNLPGVVSNIRRSPRGTYWVSFSSIRHAGAPNVMDLYGSQPALRMEKKDQFRQSPRHAMAVELDENGRILRSIQDPTGVTFDSLNEVREANGSLYLAAMNRRYIGVVKTSDLPPVTSIADDSNGTNNTQLEILLQQLRARLSTMSKSQVDAVVLALVERLVYMMQDMRRLQNEIQQLKITTTPATLTTPTTPITVTTTPGGSSTSPLSTVSTTLSSGLTTTLPLTSTSSSPASTGTESTTPVTTMASSASSSTTPSAVTTSADPSLTTSLGATPQSTTSPAATSSTTTAATTTVALSTAANPTTAASTASTTSDERPTTAAADWDEGTTTSVTTGITTTAATGSTTSSGVTTSGITTTAVSNMSP